MSRADAQANERRVVAATIVVHAYYHAMAQPIGWGMAVAAVTAAIMLN